MNYLFIDVDGVLNNIPFLVDSHKHRMYDDICPDNLQNLKLICGSIPNLRVVLSSSWRHGFNKTTDDRWVAPGRQKEALLKHLEEISVTLFDITPSYSYKFSDYKLNGFSRQYEILDYVLHHLDSEKDCFMILDDEDVDCDLLFGSHFYRTDVEEGLTEKDAKKIIRRFKKQILQKGLD